MIAPLETEKFSPGYYTVKADIDKSIFMEVGNKEKCRYTCGQDTVLHKSPTNKA